MKRVKLVLPAGGVPIGEQPPQGGMTHALQPLVEALQAQLEEAVLARRGEGAPLAGGGLVEVFLGHLSADHQGQPGRQGHGYEQPLEVVEVAHLP